MMAQLFGWNIIVLLVLFSHSQSKCQSTFNLVYSHGDNMLTTRVWEVDNFIYTAGWFVDTTGLHKSFESRHSLAGDEELFREFDAPDGYWHFSWDVSEMLYETVSVHGAIYYRDGFDMASLFWIGPDCDTLFTRNYNSPYLGIGEETDWMRPTSIDVDPEHNIYVSCQLFLPGETSNDFMIMKLNAQGDSLWSYLVNEEGSEYCMDIQAMEDGVLIAGGGVNNNSSQTFIKLNADGEWQWQFDLDEEIWPINIPNEMVVESDGIVVACEYTYDGTFYRLPAILKTNFSGELQWIVMRPGSDMAYQYNNHLVKSADGGYLAAAWQYEENPPDPELNGNFNWNAWLIKVSQEGVLEWERFYHFVESTNDKHRVYDLKATSDGGYIFCGDAIDEDVETNGQVIQQGWLVKVDACGCLVPGCDVDCTVGIGDQSEAERKYFIFGPNPVSQYLNIYFFEAQQDAKLVVYDMTGKQLDSFVPRTGNTTYMLDVEDYPPGTYVLSLQSGGRIVQSERVVVE